jgi:predicted ATP-dependent protease
VPAALTPEALRRRYDAGALGFASTTDVADIDQPVGQPRAAAAIDLAARIDGTGFNAFAFGAPGTSPVQLATSLLRARAAERPPPSDLCYVYNFLEPHKPRILVIPAGQGSRLRDDMASLVEELRSALVSAFESEQYRQRREAIDREFKARPERLLHELHDRATRDGLALIHTPVGFGFAAVHGEEPMTDEEFEKLPEDERRRLRERVHALQEELGALLRQIPARERERRARVRQLDREVVENAVGHIVHEVRAKYAALPAVAAHIDAVEHDLIENAHSLLDEHDEGMAEDSGEPPRSAGPRRGALRRYEVNLLVDNERAAGAPVVVEDDPTVENLIGRIDAISRFGTLLTDFTLIRPGALHRASGGYLVLDALRMLRAPLAWDVLKLTLATRQVRVEPFSRLLGLGSTVSLEPEPLAIDVRVILFGEPWVYYLLAQHDPEFALLFRIAADIADDLEATDENRVRYVRLVATLARREQFLPFEASGVARLLEESSRLAGDQDRLSLRTEPLLDLMREADHLARAGGVDRIDGGTVDQAVAARIFRLDRLRERMQEEMLRGTIMIDTTGAKVGQVNGLSVVPLADFSFGRASRITARVRVGSGKVVDIEREVELGGPIHTKGVLILGSFLAGRYALKSPLSLHASLVFEQSYTAVEGDSASAAELCALLSAIASAPLTQRIAVTGSVNQHGDVQPVGSINEKIEGFFDLCLARGLTGDHGVLIPATNARHLMLRRDVVEAVAAGQFHVYTMNTIDDALELLTGLPAGARNEAGLFPPGSVNQLVELQLEEYARERREFDSPLVAPAIAGAPPLHPASAARQAPGNSGIGVAPP